MGIRDFFRWLMGTPSALSSQPADDYELAEAVHFDHFVLHVIRQLTDAPLERMKASNGAAGYRPDALQFTTSQADAGRIISQLKAALRGKDYIVFHSEQNFGHSPDEIAILKTGDQFDILRCKGTDGQNHGIDNEALISTLKIWHAETPFEITGADYDWLEARFQEQPANWDAMAEKVYAFCPDVVDQGTGTVEALAAEMKGTSMLYLWWD